MKRDVCYFFNTDVQSLYNAYLTAAKNPPFKRDCKEEPFHTITFGLNFSFKYNMNGGACTLHFIPYENGSAIDLRFSIAQATGARYGAYAEYLTEHAGKNLGLKGTKTNIPIETFLDERNKVTQSSGFGAPVTPFLPQQPAVTPVQTQPVAANANTFCGVCGGTLKPGARFCGKCGNRVN